MSRFRLISLLAMFMAYLAVLIFRHVDFWVYPRFVAEEATVYYVDALARFCSSLTGVHLGYYSIVPNVSTFVATYLPLEIAPVVTTATAMVVQLLPCIIIMSSRSQYFDSDRKKFLSLTTVLIVGSTGEIWLNSITSQFHFVIILFLVLIEGIDQNLGLIRKCALLLLVLVGGLSGVPGNLMLPVFLVVYWFRRNRILLLMSLVLVATAGAQLYFVVTSELENRSGEYYPSLIPRLISYAVLYPLAGKASLNAAALIVAPLIYVLFRQVRGRPYFYLFFGTSVYLTVSMFFMSLELKGAPRYAYASSVIFVLGLMVSAFDRVLTLKVRKIIGFYLVLVFLVWIYRFPFEEGQWDSKGWARWQEQVVQYRAGEIDKIKVYPQWEGVDWSIAP